MKFKYNADLELQHITLNHRLANHFGKDESTILVKEEDFDQFPGGDGFVVASFDKHGFCNNASPFDSEQHAWEFFYELISESWNNPVDGAQTHAEVPKKLCVWAL